MVFFPHIIRVIEQSRKARRSKEAGRFLRERNVGIGLGLQMLEAPTGVNSPLAPCHLVVNVVSILA